MRLICPRCRQRFPDDAGVCAEHGLALELDPFIGMVIDRWTLVDHVGEGAMGVVYRAEPDAAIKILNARRATMQPDLIRRFDVEATAASRLSSPHVARVHGSGTTADGHLYIAMDMLSGVPLDEVIARFPRISADGVVAMAYQAAHALAEAHEKHIVHRDLKPANLFVEPLPGRRTHIRVLDFGIARINSASVARSRTGTVAGTPAYMSPEQLRGQVDIDGRSDIYSLGLVMYELLAGQNPFRGAGMMDTLRRHLDEPPPPLPASVPPPLARLVLAMLSKDRADRPPSMTAVRSWLERTGLLPEDANDTLDMGPLPELALGGGPISDQTRPPGQTSDAPHVMPEPETIPSDLPAPTHRARWPRVVGAVAIVAALAGIGGLVSWGAMQPEEAGEDFGPDHLTVGSQPMPEAVVAQVIPSDAEVADAMPVNTPGGEPAHPSPPPKPVRKPRATTSAAAGDKRLRRLLDRGRKAMEDRDYAVALKYYEQWLDEVHYLSPPHPQLEVIKSRVSFLRDIQ